METIRVALHAPLDGFANEFCDVLKLFYAVEAFHVNPETDEDAEPLTQQYEEKDGRAYCTFLFRGETENRDVALPSKADYADEPERLPILPLQ